MEGIIKFLVDLLSKASILIGIVAMIGLIAQGKPFGAVVAGTVKTILGFLILGAGAGVVVGAIVPLGGLTELGFGLKGALPVNEVFVAIAQEKLGAVIGYVFAISASSSASSSPASPPSSTSSSPGTTFYSCLC